MKKIVWLISASGILLLILLGQWLNYRSLGEETLQIAQIENLSEEILKEIADYYISHEKGYLSKDLDKAKLQELYLVVKQFIQEQPEQQRLILAYNQLSERYLRQESVNALYLSRVIQGERVQIAGALNADFSAAEIEAIRLANQYNLVEDAFQASVNELLDYASREAHNYRFAQGEWEDVIALAIERDNLAILSRAFIEFEEAEAEVQNITYRQLLEANYLEYERVFLKELKAIREADSELNFQEIFSQSRRLKRLEFD